MDRTEVQEVVRISKRIHRLLRGQRPEVQGAVLCDLLAIWIVGHAPPLRAAVLSQHLETLPKLIEVNETIIFGAAGHPARQQ